MDALDITALVALLITVGLVVALIWFLGGLPGRVAKQRNHPYAEAIQVGGWATLVLAGVGWPFVLMWAYASSGAEGRDELQRLTERVDELSREVRALGGGR
jgi:hypothetical protein